GPFPGEWRSASLGAPVQMRSLVKLGEGNVERQAQMARKLLLNAIWIMQQPLVADDTHPVRRVRPSQSGEGRVLIGPSLKFDAVPLRARMAAGDDIQRMTNDVNDFHTVRHQGKELMAACSPLQKYVLMINVLIHRMAQRLPGHQFNITQR